MFVPHRVSSRHVFKREQLRRVQNLRTLADVSVPLVASTLARPSPRRTAAAAHGHSAANNNNNNNNNKNNSSSSSSHARNAHATAGVSASPLPSITGDARDAALSPRVQAVLAETQRAMRHSPVRAARSTRWGATAVMAASSPGTARTHAEGGGGGGGVRYRSTGGGGMGTSMSMSASLGAGVSMGRESALRARAGQLPPLTPRVSDH